MPRLPLVGVTTCIKRSAPYPNLLAGDEYLCAVVGGRPVGFPRIVPTLDESVEQTIVLDSIDSLRSTGSLLDVEPRRYCGPAGESGTCYSTDHSGAALPLIRTAIGVGIRCSFQETNVVFGDNLHQTLIFHRREPDNQPLVVYMPLAMCFLQHTRARHRLSSEMRGNSVHG